MAVPDPESPFCEKEALEHLREEYGLVAEEPARESLEEAEGVLASLTAEEEPRQLLPAGLADVAMPEAAESEGEPREEGYLDLSQHEADLQIAGGEEALE